MGIEIKSLDSVWTEINKEGYLALLDYLSYTKVYWQAGFNGRKVRKEYTKRLIHKSGKKYFFLTGLVKKCLLFLQESGYNYDYSNDIPAIGYDPPKVKGIKFREYQDEIIHTAITKGRGVLQAVTGSGKSFAMLGILSAFSMENCLILAHNTSIVQQLFGVLKEHNFDPEILTTKKISSNRICVSTIQTFKRVVLEYTNYFDVIIVDEAHHVQDIESKNYG